MDNLSIELYGILNYLNSNFFAILSFIISFATLYLLARKTKSRMELFVRVTSSSHEDIYIDVVNRDVVDTYLSSSSIYIYMGNMLIARGDTLKVYENKPIKAKSTVSIIAKLCILKKSLPVKKLKVKFMGGDGFLYDVEIDEEKLKNIYSYFETKNN